MGEQGFTGLIGNPEFLAETPKTVVAIPMDVGVL